MLRLNFLQQLDEIKQPNSRKYWNPFVAQCRKFVRTRFYCFFFLISLIWEIVDHECIFLSRLRSPDVFFLSKLIFWRLLLLFSKLSSEEIFLLHRNWPACGKRRCSDHCINLRPPLLFITRAAQYRGRIARGVQNSKQVDKAQNRLRHS